MLKIDRKALVAELLASSGKRAEREAAIINSAEAPSVDFIYTHLRKYVLSKYMLDDSCTEDGIKALALESLQRTLKINKNAIHELDTATPCNKATSESTKKVMLLYAIQKDLHLPENPGALAACTTVTELAAYVHSMLPLRGPIVK